MADVYVRCVFRYMYVYMGLHPNCSQHALAGRWYSVYIGVYIYGYHSNMAGCYTNPPKPTYSLYLNVYQKPPGIWNIDDVVVTCIIYKHT